jgi:HK97 family phage portal protein
MGWFSRSRQQLRPGRGPGTVLTATDGKDVLLNSPDGWEVEQPALWWTGGFGGNYVPGSGQTLGNPIPGGDPSQAWMSLPTVTRATSLIVDTLAGLPWAVLRGQEHLPDPEWLTDPQSLRMDGRIVDSALPEDRMSRMDLRTQWLTSALWYGDGFLYVPSRDAFGAPKPPLYVLHPADVEIEGGRYFVGDSDTPMRPGEIIHLRGMGPVIAGRGQGVFDRFASQLGYAWTLRAYASSIFSSGVPAGYLKVSREGLAQDKADQLKAAWLNAHGGYERSIAVLNSTTDFHPLTFSPVDTELIAAMNANTTELANAFGLAPYMLGGGTDSNTYANIESRRADFATFTLLPWTQRIEPVLDAQLPRGTNVKIAMDALLRPDTTVRYSAYQIGLAAGFLTVDEVREKEDLPPLPKQPAPAVVAVEEGAVL